MPQSESDGEITNPRDPLPRGDDGKVRGGGRGWEGAVVSLSRRIASLPHRAAERLTALSDGRCECLGAVRMQERRPTGS